MEIPDLVRTLGHPQRRSLQRLAAGGALVRVLPAVYVRADLVEDRQVRLAAACLWSRRAVLWGDSAWQAAFGDDTAFSTDSVIRLAHPLYREPRVGISWTCQPVPEEFIRYHGARRFVDPLVVAVERAPRDDGRALAHLQPQGVESGDLTHVADWFHRRRRNPLRSRIVREFAGNPWSPPERDLHRLMNRAGIQGWVANNALRLGATTIHPDVLFPEHRIVIEVDGRAFHSDATAFERDRERQNLLVLHGYRVLRFTWRMIADNPEAVLATIRRALR